LAHLWSKTPESVTTDPRLTRTAHRLYQYLDLRAGQRGSWWGPQHEIARELGIHERTVRKALAQLLAGGYIRVERTIEHRTQNIYLVAARASQTGPHGPVGEARTGRSERPARAGRSRGDLYLDPQITPQITPQARAQARAPQADPYRHLVRRFFEDGDP